MLQDSSLTNNLHKGVVLGCEWATTYGDNLFRRGCCNRTRVNGFKLKKDQSRVAIRKKFFYNEND